MKTLVSAAMSAAISTGAGNAFDIVYIPEGIHTINPRVNGVGQQITVRVPPERGHEIAAKFQADLATRQGDSVRPWFSFQHQVGAASGLPQSFRYQPGKGIMCTGEWTGGGKEGIDSRNWSYFSPTFLMEDDGIPAGLPSRGELGALTNEPAFRQGMQRIAASDAGGQDDRFYRDMAVSAGYGELGDEQEAIGIIRHYGLNPGISRLTEPTPEKKDQPKVRLSVNASDFEVKAAGIVQAGRADTMDEALAIAASESPELYPAYLNSLSNKPSPREVNAAYAAHEANPAAGLSELRERAQSLVTACQASSLDTAMEAVLEQSPELYGAYITTLSKR